MNKNKNNNNNNKCKLGHYSTNCHIREASIGVAAVAATSLD